MGMEFWVLVFGLWSFFGILACWRFGLLALWLVGLLACWRFGLLALWLVGLLALWLVGTLGCWHFGVLALWSPKLHFVCIGLYIFNPIRGILPTLVLTYSL